MKLILQSKQLLTSESVSHDKIHVITQFFLPNDSYRLNEIQYALKQNIHNNYIHYIHLLNEKIYNAKELGIEGDKIIQTNIRIDHYNISANILTANIRKYILKSKSFVNTCLNNLVTFNSQFFRIVYFFIQ